MKELLRSLIAVFLYPAAVLAVGLLGRLGAIAWIFSAIVMAYISSWFTSYMGFRQKGIGAYLPLSAFLFIVLFIFGKMPFIDAMCILIITGITSEILRARLGYENKTADHICSGLMAFCPFGPFLSMWTHRSWYLQNAFYDMGEAYSIELGHCLNPYTLLTVIACIFAAGFFGSIQAEGVYKKLHIQPVRA